MNHSEFRLSHWLRTTTGQIFLILLVVATVYLITEHTAHVLNVLPYALLLLCPLLHLLMHMGHGLQAGDEDGSDHSKKHIH